MAGSTRRCSVLNLIKEAAQLTNNFIGAIFLLFMQNFPFCFLMLLGYISGIDPSLENSGTNAGGRARTIFRCYVAFDRTGLAIAFALVFVMNPALVCCYGGNAGSDDDLYCCISMCLSFTTVPMCPLL